MSIDDNPFQLSPTLQHLATVKIIALLLRDPKYKKMMKEAAWETRPGMRIRRGVVKLRCIIEKSKIEVDGFSLPEVVKFHLKISFVSMIKSATYWLGTAGENTPARFKKQYWNETIYELMRHLQWDNFVCVDGQKTLESYISNRKTVDFIIWNQLCYHCMEDDIIRFSKNINWEKCKKSFASAYPVYWYWKIYGELPTKKIYQSRLYKKISSTHSYPGKLDAIGMLRSMFDPEGETILRSGKTVSAMRYFRNCLKDDQRFVRLAISRTNFPTTTDGVVLYLLSTIDLNTLCIPSFGMDGKVVIGALVEVPFILFIDDWISAFETLDASWITCFFAHMGLVKMNNKRDIFDWKYTLYEPFKKMWRIFYRRFSSVRENMVSAFKTIIQTHDIILCDIMFKGMGNHQRILLMEDTKDYAEKHGYHLHDKLQFSLQFSEQVLQNDEEKKLFAQIPKGPTRWMPTRRMFPTEWGE